MGRDENAELKAQLSALQSDYDEVKKDRDEWEKIAETRLTEIRRLRQVIREINENTDSPDGQSVDK